MTISVRLAEEEKQTYLEEREELAAAFAEHEALEAEKMKRLKQVKYIHVCSLDPSHLWKSFHCLLFHFIPTGFLLTICIFFRKTSPTKTICQVK